MKNILRALIWVIVITGSVVSCGPSKAELEARVAYMQDSVNNAPIENTTDSSARVKIYEISCKIHYTHSYHLMVVGEDTVLALYGPYTTDPIALIKLSK